MGQGNNHHPHIMEHHKVNNIIIIINRPSKNKEEATKVVAVVGEVEVVNATVRALVKK